MKSALSVSSILLCGFVVANASALAGCSPGTDGGGSGGAAATSGGAATASGGAGTASGGAGAASGGAATGSGGAAACDVAMVLSKKCAAATCHGKSDGSTPPTLSDLDLFAAGVESRLYNKPATYKGVDQSTAANPTACPTTAELLIDPAGLDKSLMWKKITETHACGDKMPSIGSLDDMQKACVQSWIEGIIAAPPK